MSCCPEFGCWRINDLQRELGPAASSHDCSPPRAAGMQQTFVGAPLLPPLPPLPLPLDLLMQQRIGDAPFPALLLTRSLWAGRGPGAASGTLQWRASGGWKESCWARR